MKYLQQALDDGFSITWIYPNDIGIGLYKKINSGFYELTLFNDNTDEDPILLFNRKEVDFEILKY